jgi:hypothetical protein
MKDLQEYINEEKKTTGAGCVEMVKTMIDHLLANPDYKGKDKDLWEGAAYFLYDYLKELNNSDYEKIVKELDLPDLRNNKDEEFSAPAVQSAIALKLTTN